MAQTVTVTLRTAEALAQIKQAVFEGTKETFEEIKASAKGHAHFGKYATGATAESIDFSLEEVPEGVRAELFTQSGHGGYVELGTKHNRAEPYLRPAVDENIGKLPELVKEKLGG